MLGCCIDRLRPPPQAIENVFFDYVIVGLRPAFRYPLQINRNLKAGNVLAMTLADTVACQPLVS